MNIFDKYIEQGRNKSESIYTKIDEVAKILNDLSASLYKHDIKLDYFNLKNNRGVGFQTIIFAGSINKNFITITVGYNDENIYYLEYNGEVQIIKSIGELVDNIGYIVSSSEFWQDIDRLKMMNMKNI